MALYYLPVLIRSDRYFVAKLESDSIPGNREKTEFNFVAFADAGPLQGERVYGGVGTGAEVDGMLGRGFVELGSAQRHPHLVVVPMRILALSLVIAQVMACGERVFYRNFKHEILERRRVRRASRV